MDSIAKFKYADVAQLGESDKREACFAPMSAETMDVEAGVYKNTEVTPWTV